MSISGKLQVRLAAGPAEVAAAQRIRYEAYRAQGYVQEDGDARLTDAYDDLPDTAIMVATQGARMVGTLRLVFDGAAGLPMDHEGYADVLAPLRRAGRRLAEPCKLSLLPEYRNFERFVVLDLKRLMLRVAESRDVDDLVIAVVPEHRAFYEQQLLFEPLSDCRPYHSLGELTSLALRLDLRTAQQRLWERYHGSAFDLHAHFYGRDAGADGDGPLLGAVRR